MGWNEVNAGGHTAQADNAEQEKREANEKALRQAMQKALSGGNQRPLRDFLKRTALAGSYSPGRSHADMAYTEGMRALAVKLLHLGGENE